MNNHDIIRAAAPGADDGFCGWIMWNRTPFPMGALTPRELYKATSSWVRACRNGRQLCDFCDRQAQSETFVCTRCEAMFRGDSEAAA